MEHRKLDELGHRKLDFGFDHRRDWDKVRPYPSEVERLSGGDDVPVRDLRQAATLGWVKRELLSDDGVATRARRMVEEALELAQSVGTSEEEARRVLEHVYSRPKGTPFQEVGGVTVTLMSLAEALGISVASAEIAEFVRIHSLPPGHFHARQKEKKDAGL